MFLAHAERKVALLGEYSDYMLWFNGASDHLYELIIPKSFPKDLRERLGEFQKKVLHWGHGFSAPKATDEDFRWALLEARELLRLIDEQIGVKTIEASWK
jgi:hypothetical protein